MSTVAAPPCSSLFNDLQTHLRTAVDCTPAKNFSLSSLDVPALAPILQRTIGSDGEIQGAVLTVGEGELQLAGTIPVFGTTLNISIAAMDTNAGLTCECRCTQPQGSTLLLPTVVKQLVPRAARAAVPALQLTGFSLDFGTDKSDFSATATCQWPLQIGETQCVVTATVALSAGSATLTGTLALGDAGFLIECDLGKDANSISGTWTNLKKPISWDSLVSAAGLSTSLDLPAGVPSPAFASIELLLDLSNEKVELIGETVDRAVAFVALGKIGGAWGFAFGVERADACEPGDLSSELKVLDFFQLSQAHLVFSSYADPNFTLPAWSTSAQPLAFPLTTGLNLAAQVAIDGTRPGHGKVLGKIFGSTGATLSATFDKEITLSASAGGPLTIPSSSLVLQAPQLNITIQGPAFDVCLVGEMDFPLLGHVFQIHASLDINETGFLGKISTTAVPPVVLDAPFGLHGVGIANISGGLGLTLEPLGVKLTGGVDFFLDQPNAASPITNAFALSLQIGPDEIDPLYLVGEINQPVTLETIAYTVLPELTIPPALNGITLNNLNVSFCNPQQMLGGSQLVVDGKAVPAGYSFAGELTAFGWSMQGALSLQPPLPGAKGEVHGAMQMDPINLRDGLVTITGGSAALMQSLGFQGTGPAFSFSLPPLPNSTIASGALSVQILGAVSASVIAQIEANGFLFHITISVDGSESTVQVQLRDKKNLNASAILMFRIVLDLDLPLPGGRTVRHHLDAQFIGRLSLAVTDAASVSLDIEGNFDGKALPPLHLDENAGEIKTALTNVGALIRNQITAEAATLYRDVIADAQKAADAGKEAADTVKAGAQTTANDVKSEAKDALKKLHI